MFVGVLSEPVSNPHDPHGAGQQAATTRAVVQALRKAGHQVEVVNLNELLKRRLQGPLPWDVVFNLFVGRQRRADQLLGVTLLEWAGIPYTGSPPPAHLVAIHKHLAKALWKQAGLPTPAFQVWTPGGEADLTALPYPAIVKPAAEGSGLGLDDQSIVSNPTAAEEACWRVWSCFPGPILVEQYIAGREFTVGLLPERRPDRPGGWKFRALPPMEIAFHDLPPGKPPIYSSEVKTAELAQRICPVPGAEQLQRRLQQLALRAFRVIGGQGHCRFDFRVDETGTAWLIEVNTLPGLEPAYSDLPVAAEVAGIGYTGLVERLVREAIARRRRLPATEVASGGLTS